jgi:hypothetical protein
MNTASPADILRQRLALVAKVSALTAEALKLRQMLAGAQMDVLRCELEIGRMGSGGQLVRDLHKAEASAAAVEAARAECEQRIATVEREVADLDSALAAAR